MQIELPVKLPPISTWKQSERSWMDVHALCTAKPYTDDEMDAFFDVFGIPEDGRRYILRSRKEAPTRSFPGRGGNVISRYTSRKMGARLGTESKGVEFPAVIKADFDGFTHELYTQPLQVFIPTVITRRSSRNKITEYKQDVPYTPDLLLLTDYGPFVDEWKTESELLKLTKKYPKRFYKDGDETWHCPDREAYFKKLGITYRVRSSVEHGDLYTFNLGHLSDYLQVGARPLSEDARAAIHKALKSHEGAMSLAALNELAFDDGTPWSEDVVMPTPSGHFRVDDVLKAIADGVVFVDLEFDDLSEPHIVVVCSSREQLELVKWRRPPPHAVETAFTLTADIGTEFMFYGRGGIYNIVAITETEVFYRDANAEVAGNMSIIQFESLMFSAKGIKLLFTQKSVRELLKDNPPVSDKQVEIANQRFSALAMLDRIKLIPGVTARTVQRWRKKMRGAGDSQPLQKLALIPGRPGGRGPQVSLEVLRAIEEVATGANNSTNPNAAHSYKAFEKLCENRTLKPCSKNTFYLRSEMFRDIRARLGARREYNESPAVWYLNRHDKIHGGRPFHRVHIDHTKLDIIIKIRGVGGRMYRLRPWLTVVMDAETRAVLAFYLAAHPP